VEQSEAVLDLLEFAQETGSAAFGSFELEVRACANIIHPVRRPPYPGAPRLPPAPPSQNPC